MPGQHEKCFLCGQLGHLAAKCRGLGQADNSVELLFVKRSTRVPLIFSWVQCSKIVRSLAAYHEDVIFGIATRSYMVLWQFTDGNKPPTVLAMVAVVLANGLIKSGFCLCLQSKLDLKCSHIGLLSIIYVRIDWNHWIQSFFFFLLVDGRFV